MMHNIFIIMMSKHSLIIIFLFALFSKLGLSVISSCLKSYLGEVYYIFVCIARHVLKWSDQLIAEHI